LLFAGPLNGFVITKLLHTRYRVEDLEKTVSFYRDVLGLKEIRRHTSGRGSQLVFLKAPGSEEEIELCKSGPT
jgi:lactoylglutathione lyase